MKGPRRPVNVVLDICCDSGMWFLLVYFYFLLFQCLHLDSDYTVYIMVVSSVFFF